MRKICDEFGIMMICDEVMAGWYRTGKMFAYMNFDVVPDIITFAKGVNSGYIPLGGTIVKELKNRGFVTYSHENVIIVAPPLIITEEQIDEELAKLDEVLSIVDEKYI